MGVQVSKTSESLQLKFAHVPDGPILVSPFLLLVCQIMWSLPFPVHSCVHSVVGEVSVVSYMLGPIFLE